MLPMLQKLLAKAFKLSVLKALLPTTVKLVSATETSQLASFVKRLNALPSSPATSRSLPQKVLSKSLKWLIKYVKSLSALSLTASVKMPLKLFPVSMALLMYRQSLTTIQANSK